MQAYKEQNCMNESTNKFIHQMFGIIILIINNNSLYHYSVYIFIHK